VGKENLSDQEAKAQKGEAHHQAGPTPPHQTLEFQMIQPRTIREVVVDRFYDKVAIAVSLQRLPQVDD